jgi:hypothetical protein
MDNRTSSNQPPVPTDAPLPATTNEGEPPAQFDINGFNPDDFEWRPVLRRRRTDGWSPDVQRRFIEALAETGLVESAAEAVDMSVQSAYRLRRAPGGEGFARAWRAAIDHAVDRLIDMTMQRAIEGEELPYYDRDGVRLGSRRRYNDRMAMFLMRAYRPDRFRDAHLEHRDPAAPLPRPEPLEPALAALTPVTPADPHRLMDPDRLHVMLDDQVMRAELEAERPEQTRERYKYRMAEPSHPHAIERSRKRRGLPPREEDMYIQGGTYYGGEYDGGV